MSTGLDCAEYCKEVFEGFDIDGIDFEQLLGSSAPEQRSSAAPRLSPPKESSGPLLQQHSSLEANPRHPAAHGALPWQACASMPGMPSLVYPLPTILGGLPAQPLLPLGHQLSAQQHPEVLRQQQEQEPQQQAQPPEQAPPCHGLPLFVSSQTGTRAQEQQQRCEGLLERYWRFTMMQRQGGQAAVAAAQQQHHLGSAATLTPCPPSPHDHGQLPQGSDAASLQRSIDVAVAAAAAAQQQRQQWQQQPGSMLGSRPRSVPPLALPATHPQQSAGNACASGSAGGKCQPLKRCWSEVAGLQPVVEQSVSGGQLGDWARLVAASLGPAVQPGPPKPSSGGSAALQAAAPADSDLLKSAAAAVPFGQGCKEAEAATTDQQSQAKLSIDEQMKLRRREQARASRARKRVYIKSLERQNEELRQEASRLHRILHAWATQGFVTPEQAQQFLVEKVKDRQPLSDAAAEGSLPKY